uniref:Uncharacterized protein n=1 Tax=Siphoviridae sp. ctekV29 TaxID=2826406 RepID=A0A8S5QLR4_9CAUD|nr:MAG TPA: hypothetical protein [Siphoviridae sp. ctekV29]
MQTLSDNNGHFIAPNHAPSTILPQICPQNSRFYVAPSRFLTRRFTPCIIPTNPFVRLNQRADFSPCPILSV